MNRLGVTLVVGLGLACLCEPPRALARSSATVPPASAPRPQRSSSWWFKKGESHQWRYEYAEAGAAYFEAFNALSRGKQRGNRGARMVMLAADAYWFAFEHDADAAHLQKAIEALERWLVEGGPSSKVKLRSSVEPMAEDIRAVLDPLLAADAAFERGDLALATEHQTQALSALTRQDRAWSCGTLVVVRLAQEHQSAYDQLVAPLEVGEDMSRAEDVERLMPRLETVRDVMLDWQTSRPPNDPSLDGAVLERQLAAIEDRISDAQLRIEAAARKRQADERAREERQLLASKEAEQRRLDQEQAAREEETRKQRRKASIVMWPVGTVVAAGGATALGLGLAFNEEERRMAVDLRAEPRRVNIGLIAGGSTLLAGGLATAIIGITWFARYRRPGRGRSGERAKLSPTGSRSTFGLSLSKRF